MTNKQRKLPKAKRAFTTDMETIAQLGMCDVLVIADPTADVPGWVGVLASDKGKASVNALFPSLAIQWGISVEHPGWSQAGINIPKAVASMPDHKLPMQITDGKPLDEAQPDALAFLLAWGAKEQGATVAHHTKFGRGAVHLYQPKVH